MTRSRSRAWRPAAAAMAVGLLASCSSTAPADDTTTVMAAFYPLEYVAGEVGGSSVTVESLTPAGAEPHDVELSPQQIASIDDADLILYIKGFQPAIDEAVAQVAPDRAVDVSQGITLLTAPGSESGVDPHIWLDPDNMRVIAATVRDRLAAVNPADEASYTTAKDQLDGELEALDRRWAAGTKDCTNRDLVVSHEAFAYLADRYDFSQVGISGVSPDIEPSPAQAAQVADFVRANDVRTIYFETLVDPKVAQTVAAETGAATAVLDPLEGLPEGSDATYLSVMEDNLATVQSGQPCR